MMKGISLNVTISPEQIDEIASKAADKINYTNKFRSNTEDWLKSEIEDLKRDLNNRNKMIVEREIQIDRWKESSKLWYETAKKYEEKYGKLD